MFPFSCVSEKKKKTKKIVEKRRPKKYPQWDHASWQNQAAN